MKKGPLADQDGTALSDAFSSRTSSGQTRNSCWTVYLSRKCPFSIIFNLTSANATISVIDHLGQGIAQLATSDPQSIKNTDHSFVTFWPTGQEVIELYTKINGKPAQIKTFTSKDREDFRADTANFGAAKVGYWDYWESGQWEYETGGKLYHKNYQGPGIEEVARRFAWVDLVSRKLFICPRSM